ncbi:hypothetical protein CHLNCDRAFT_137600 [Chlorella variabilis]|uniref:procollagen-proline 4-dioxygenase n=1 Tax=Chlorella variabilis TaxID=554065 RepID=E1Z424_CHLVA|nr:hypothetical protein CHLNCDRAFT_137600 [Chlorella variabilis]EFN58979.1 hypothetical protein CHLNCDRAFT_137600 [Chlorella variabilis]|eukprot:XP_005851081.1 hypothetical protein CHLNCDRAFT_137600 [Chlorella variabilis]
MRGGGLGSTGAVLALALLLAGVSTPRIGAAAISLGNQTHGWVEVVAWKPRALLLHGFLSHAECDHIIRVADPSLERSTVVSPEGGSMLDEIRTSSGMFILKGHDAVISGLEERVAALTHLPVSHQEDLQVLRYELGQKYSAHWDINDSPERAQQMRAKGVLGGLRTATLLMYLSDVEEGGETAFPHGRWLDEGVQAAPPYTECASKGVVVKPRKGDAILFFSLKLNGQKKDVYSLHAGCPVVRGVKYSATKWVHVEPFGHTTVQQPSRCEDARVECPQWAAAGECDSNPVYMKGSEVSVGSCRLSCKVCRPCPKGDVLCERENARAR